jgi:acyl-[acyl-carrier-protein] desaturase
MNFKMPGAVMPDFENRMAVIAKEANYGPLQYFNQMLDVVVDYWGLKDLRPIAPLAKKRIEILEYHTRLKKILDRFSRFQGKTDLR